MKNDQLFQESTDEPASGDQRLDMDKFSTSEEGDDFLSGFNDEPPAPGQDHLGDINEDGGQENEYNDGTDPDDVEFDMNEMLDNDHNMIELDEDEFEDEFQENQNNDADDRTDDDAGVDDAEQLAAMNKALDTKYESIKELKAALNGTDKTEDGLPPVEQLPAEKIETYNKNKSTIDYFEKQKDKSDRDIVYDYFVSKEKKSRGVDKLTEDQEEELDDKLSVMDTSGTLDLYARNLRKDIDGAIDKLTGVNREIEGEQKQIVDRRDSALKTGVQDTMTDFFTKDFFGIKLDKERTKKAYDSVINNKIFESIEKSPKLMAEVALFLEYKETLAQKTSGPSYSDGIKDIMGEIAGKKPDPMTAQVRSRSIATKTKSNDLKSRWLS